MHEWLDRHVLEPSGPALMDERADENVLLEDAVVANGRRRDRRISMPLSRFRKQGHTVVGEHSCDFAYRVRNVWDMVNGAQTDHFLEYAGSERQRFHIARHRADSGARTRTSGAKHVQGDVHGNCRPVQPTEQVRAPARARAKIQNQIVCRRLQRQHGHGKVMQHPRALIEGVRARRGKWLRAFPRRPSGAREVFFFSLSGVGGCHAGSEDRILVVENVRATVRASTLHRKGSGVAGAA